MHEFFRKTIIANPADNLPRLVYADYLDEEKQWELAEFIRLQCAKGSTCKRTRQLILAHGETWAGNALSSFTHSGNYGAFDKIAGEKYGRVCRFPEDYAYKNYGNLQTYTFDLSDLDYWKENTIEWSAHSIVPIYIRNTEYLLWDTSGIAFTRGFPSHWRGKVLDWFRIIGRNAVKNYPIERVEFCDLLEHFRNRYYRFNFDIRMRFPTLLKAGEVEISEIADIQNQLSLLAIEAVR